MKRNNVIFPWRIREGACLFMSRVLSYPEQVDRRMDGQICRITVTAYTIKANIRPAFHKELEEDHLWQMAVLGIEDREFLVLQSLLIALDEDMVVGDPDGKIFYKE